MFSPTVQEHSDHQVDHRHIQRKLLILCFAAHSRLKVRPRMAAERCVNFSRAPPFLLCGPSYMRELPSEAAVAAVN
jgi:hypothetical protein